MVVHNVHIKKNFFWNNAGAATITHTRAKTVTNQDTSCGSAKEILKTPAHCEHTTNSKLPALRRTSARIASTCRRVVLLLFLVALLVLQLYLTRASPFSSWVFSSFAFRFASSINNFLPPLPFPLRCHFGSALRVLLHLLHCTSLHNHFASPPQRVSSSTIRRRPSGAYHLATAQR